MLLPQQIAKEEAPAHDPIAVSVSTYSGSAISAPNAGTASSSISRSWTVRRNTVRKLSPGPERPASPYRFEAVIQNGKRGAKPWPERRSSGLALPGEVPYTGLDIDHVQLACAVHGEADRSRRADAEIPDLIGLRARCHCGCVDVTAAVVGEDIPA